MAQDRVRLTLFLFVVALAAGLCAVLVAPFVRLIGWAVVLAILVRPLHRRLAARLRSVSLAAFVSCLVVIGVIVVPAGVVAVELVGQVAGLAARLQAISDPAPPTSGEALQDSRAAAGVRRWLERRAREWNLQPEGVARQAVGQTASFLARQSVGIVRNVGGGVVQGVLTLLTLFFLLRDGGRLLPAIRGFIPLDGEQLQALIDRVVDTVHATVYGATVVAVTQGALAGLGFWVLGVPSALLWGAVMTALCFIPFLGAPIVWIPVAISFLLRGAYGHAIGLALWGMLVVGLVDNFLRPIVIGARSQLHPLLVCFSVLGGLLWMGPLGLLLGPVILAVTLALLEMLRLRIVEELPE